MIDPSKVTNFNRTRNELEEFILFSIVVAGKSAYQQAEKLEEFLYPWRIQGYSPFQAIYAMDADRHALTLFLKDVKMGQYQRISTAFRGISYFFFPTSLDKEHPLKIAQIKTLECVKGIGMKTARFFALHSRPNQYLACLDTHVLRWLGNKGHDVPKTTPSGARYLELEKLFLDYAKEMDMLPATLDLHIWNESQVGKVEKS
mgnify:CR=1 FL=1